MYTYVLCYFFYALLGPPLPPSRGPHFASFFRLRRKDWVRTGPFYGFDAFAAADDTYAETLSIHCPSHVFASTGDGLITFTFSFYSHCLVPSSVPTPFHLYSSLPS